jgi:hypothetical protein
LADSLAKFVLGVAAAGESTLSNRNSGLVGHRQLDAAVERDVAVAAEADAHLRHDE